MQNQVFFLGFIVSYKDISADPDKVKAIREWPEHTKLFETHGFHGLVSFYRLFIKGFNTTTATIIECLKLGSFQWTLVAHKAYLDIKHKLIEAPLLRHPDLSKVFKVACDLMPHTPWHDLRMNFVLGLIKNC